MFMCCTYISMCRVADSCLFACACARARASERALDMCEHSVIGNWLTCVCVRACVFLLNT